MFKNNYSLNLKCINCGNSRSDLSFNYCIHCVNQHRRGDVSHLSKCHNKNTDWELDKDGCMVRWHGDIKGMQNGT